MLITNILLSVILVVFAGAGVIFYGNYRKIKRTLQEFVTPTAEGEFSPLGHAIDAVSSQVARAIVAQAKTTFMSSESAVARGKATVEADINQDLLAASNPVIAGIMNMFPTLRKSLRRNPGLTQFAIEKIVEKFGNKNNGSMQAAPTSQTEFKL